MMLSRRFAYKLCLGCAVIAGVVLGVHFRRGSGWKPTAEIGASADAASAAVVRPRFVFIQDTSGSMEQTPIQEPLSQATDFPLTAGAVEQCSAGGKGLPSTCQTDNTINCTTQAQCQTAKGAGWNCSTVADGLGHHHCQTCCDTTGGLSNTNGLCGPGCYYVANETCNAATNTCWYADGVPVHGDGSVDQPGCDEDGNGLYDDSKLYQAKQALLNIVSGYPEVEFALEHYHTVDNKTMSTTCGTNKCTTSADCPNDPDPGVGAVWDCNNPAGTSCGGTCQNCNDNVLDSNTKDSTWQYDSWSECGCSGANCNTTTPPATRFQCATSPPGPNGGATDIATYKAFCADWGVDKTCDGERSIINAGRTITCGAGSNATSPTYSADSSYCANYVGTVGNGGSSCFYPSGSGSPSYGGGGDMLVPFSSTTDTATQIYPWINSDESDGEELRASGATPIADSLKTTKNYLLSAGGPLATDPSIPCRGYSVIFLTDGAETCGGNPATAAAALRNLVVPRAGDAACTDPCSVSGDVCYQGMCHPVNASSVDLTTTHESCANPCGSSSLSCVETAPPAKAGTCQAVVDVKTYVIGFSLCPDGTGTCPDAQALNAIAAAGGTSTAYVATSALDIETVVSGIVSASIKPELCNGVDDNCNGLVDEGYNVYANDGVPSSGSVSCSNGLLGDCAASGVVACVPAAEDPTQTSTYCTAKICPADCSYTPTVCGIIPAGTCPTAENCMNGDADCDGVITASCPSGCENPQPEICDNVDENCNGLTDECCDSLNPGSNTCSASESANCQTFGPGGGATCGSNVGVCKPGQLECCTPGREGPIATTSKLPIVAGCSPAGCVKQMNVNNGSGIEPGEFLTVDTGGLQETVQVLTIIGANFPNTGPTGFTASFTKTHNAGAAVTGQNTCSSTSLGTAVCVGGVGPTSPVETNNKGQFCNCLDDDCNGQTDENITESCWTGPTGSSGCTPDGMGGFTCKGTCQAGIATCGDSSASGSCVASFGTCQGEVLPTADIRCSGIDSDCDGKVLGATCETCNGVDDDCNSVVDNAPNGETIGGVTCPVGWGSCYPAATAGCTQDPTTGAWTCVGSCHPGAFACINGGLVCENAGTPQTETCNGQDDDCDGHIDCVGLSTCPITGVGQMCATAGSACPGTTACVETGVNSAQIQCMASGGGASGSPCYPPATPGCTPDAASPTGYDCMGICKPGQLTCASGGVVCVGAVTPGAEVCSTLDTDCDGPPEYTGPCPNPADVCDMGTCVAPCSGELSSCPSGYNCLPVAVCKDGSNCGAGGAGKCADGTACTTFTGTYCVPNKCLGVTCPSGQTCNAGTGKCVDPCAGVTCSSNQTCVNGVCKDCTATGCPTGKICQGTPPACVPNPCNGVTCPANQICQTTTGMCIGDCTKITCPTGQFCQGSSGTCITDPCTNVTCPQDQVCNPNSGQCIADPCVGVFCQTGSTCVNGTCSPDPCEKLLCGAHAKCVVDDQTGQASCTACTPDDVHDGGGSCTPLYQGTPVLSTGGGGCTCNVGGGGGSGGGLPAGSLLEVVGLAGIVAAWLRLRRRAALVKERQ
jgi:hypothetical protein